MEGIRTRIAGIDAAALAAVAMMGAVQSGAVAHAEQIAPPGSDPYGLLAGASTHVDAAWNSSQGHLDSRVTAIKFHTNVQATDSNGIPQFNRDGSPRYIASYAPGGLVDTPAGIHKTVNGVEFIEFTGEVSGYVNRRSLNPPGNEIVYGPIDESGMDHNSISPPPVGDARYGLKGIVFILQIPAHGWNGALISNHTGGWSSSSGIYSNQHDTIYLMSQGYAHVASYANGFESNTDTNHNNDQYWDYVVSATAGGGADTARIVANQRRVYVGQTAMYTRDFAALMKNLCKYATGSPPTYTYYNPRSATGAAATAVITGVDGGGIYYGNNYVVPYVNSPLHPDHDNAEADHSMVFDGFLIYSGGGISNDLNPNIPISPAPVFYTAGASDLFGNIGALTYPAYFYSAKYEHGGGDLWPEPRQTFFIYIYEHLPHFSHLASYYAVAYNGGGTYVYDGISFTVPKKYAYVAPDPVTNPSGEMTFNNAGLGKELEVHLARLLDTLDYHHHHGLQVNPVLEAFILETTRIQYNSPASAPGIQHQLLANLHKYVVSREANAKDPTIPVVLPPVGNIDPYIFDHDVYPKFSTWSGPIGPRPNSDINDLYTALPLLGASYTVNISTVATGTFDGVLYRGNFYRMILDYIAARGQEVLFYNKMTWRTPDDAARIGLYADYAGGFFEGIDHAFTEDQLSAGFGPDSGNQADMPLDWNGQPLITMTMSDGRRIPLDGYRNHGGYVSAVAQAVNTLVLARMYDPYIGALLVQEAARSDYPLVQARDLRRCMKHDHEPSDDMCILSH